MFAAEDVHETFDWSVAFIKQELIVKREDIRDVKDCYESPAEYCELMHLLKKEVCNVSKERENKTETCFSQQDCLLSMATSSSVNTFYNSCLTDGVDNRALDCAIHDVQTTSQAMDEHLHCTKSKVCRCGECQKTVGNLRNLNRHTGSHGGDDEKPPFSCIHCGKRFLHLTQLTDHTSTHHVGIKQFSCDACGRTFLQARSLAIHERIHLHACSRGSGKRCTAGTDNQRTHENAQHGSEMPYTCVSCGKRFRHAWSLRNHDGWVHGGVKRYGCRQCGRHFAQSGHLKKHEMVHSGVKPYRCAHCGKAFTQSSNLKKHERVHTGERPYGCRHCGRTFSQSSSLKVHQKVHASSGDSLTSV